MQSLNSRRGGVLSGLLLTAMGVIILLVVAGLFVARNVHLSTTHGNTTKDFSLDMPGGGHFSMRTREDLNLASLGIPVYPGAVRKHDSGGATFEWSSGDGKENKGFAVAGADMFTTDSVDRVFTWYRDQLPDWIVVTERDGSTRLELKRGGYKRIVGIRGKSDGTHIGVASVGEPESN